MHSKRDMMKKAIADQKAKPKPVPPPKPVKAVKPPQPPAPFVPGEKPTKANRSPKARDERMKTRGRLPAGSRFEEIIWTGEAWKGMLMIPTARKDGIGPLYDVYQAEKPGVFELLEALDVMYWEAKK